MKLYCNESFVGFLDPHFSQWRLEFDHTPAVPLSPELTAHKGAVFDSETVKHFFVNYLPEEPYADRVAARLKPYPRTLADWLAALGQELTGAYALTPDGKFLDEPRYIDLKPAQLHEAMHDSRSRADAIAFALQGAGEGPSTLPRLSLAGAQDKFALWFDAKTQAFKIPEGRAASTHIFKPDSTDARYPFLPANEYACLTLARAMGLSATQATIMTLGEVRTLVVERFDRQKRGQNVKRIHQIDLCQLMNLPREKKYGSHGQGIDTEDFFKSTQHLSVPALARQHLLRTFLFNLLIGNNDTHAKNHSYLYDTTAKGWQCAPLYDVLCVLPYLPDQMMAMGLLGEYRPGWFEREHWLELARLASVSPAYLAQEMQQTADKAQAAGPHIAQHLRKMLRDDELDFLNERVNPVVVQRVQWLRDGARALLG